MRRFITILALLVSLFSVTVLTQAQEITHVVQSGENLYRISLQYGVSLTELAQANNIANPALIFVGQQLIIPGTTGGTTTPPPADPPASNPPPASGDSTSYTVQAGDTLGSIARRFGTTYTAIAAANGIANPNLIYVGQVLNINGSAPAPSNPPPVTNNPPPTVPNNAPITGFEVGGHVTNSAYPYSDAMRQSGMTWAKRQIRWDGSASASSFQGEIAAAHDRGFRILLSVVGDHNQLAANPTQYYQNFAQFLGGLAAAGADAIEVWNEPNIDREWPAGQISGANYAQMLSAAYQLIKANNPATLVISGAPAPTGAAGGAGCTGQLCNDDTFLSQMASAGAGNFMDCVGIHYNSGAVPPSATSGAPVGSASHYSWYYTSMVNTYRARFPGTPLCFTEIGYLSGEGFATGLPGNFAWASDNTVQEQAQWLAAAAVQARNSGAVRLFIVWNVDSTNYGADPQAGYAIVRPDGGCPACNTLGSAING